MPMPPGTPASDEQSNGSAQATVIVFPPQINVYSRCADGQAGLRTKALFAHLEHQVILHGVVPGPRNVTAFRDRSRQGLPPREPFGVRAREPLGVWPNEKER